MGSKSIVAGVFISCIGSLLILMVGCQGIQRVEPRDRTSLLHGAPYSGTWESIDVLLEYQYVNHPGHIKLNIQGKAKRL
jgi:hypothetical protein